MAVVVSTGNVSKNRYILPNLGIGHPYNRGEFFLKVGFNRIIGVCQVFIVAGCWFIIYLEAITGRCMGAWERFSFDIPKIQVLKDFGIRWESDQVN